MQVKENRKRASNEETRQELEAKMMKMQETHILELKKISLNNEK
jgi:hypothetical protein